MRRALILLGLVLGLVAAAPASAHPLGNFSVNHLSVVSVSADRVDVRYVLDQAEIPTAREHGMARGDVLRGKLDEVGAGSGPHGRRPPGGARAARHAAAVVPRGRGRAEHHAARAVAPGSRVRAPAGGAPGRHLPRPRGLEGRGGRARRGHGRAQLCAERRSHRRPAPLSGGPAGQPGRPPRGPLRRAARRGHAGGPEGRGRPVLREPRRGQRGLRAAVRGRCLRRGRAPAAAPRRVRLGRAPRALPGPRQGDGGRLPRGHPRPPAACGGARRHGHGHAHDRSVRARRGHAGAVPVRAGRGPLPLAHPRLRPDGPDRRRSGAAHPFSSRARARDGRPSSPRPPPSSPPRSELEGTARDGHRRRA